MGNYARNSSLKGLQIYTKGQEKFVEANIILSIASMRKTCYTYSCFKLNDMLEILKRKGSKMKVQTALYFILACLIHTPLFADDPNIENYVQGIRNYQNGRFLQAAEYFTRIIQNNPSYEDVYFCRGKTYSNIPGLEQQAIADFT